MQSNLWDFYQVTWIFLSFFFWYTRHEFLTHFMSLVSFIPPENIRKPLSHAFREYRKKLVAWNGLIDFSKEFSSFQLISWKKYITEGSMEVTYHFKFIYSKVTIETPEQGVKYVQS